MGLVILYVVVEFADQETELPIVREVFPGNSKPPRNMDELSALPPDIPWKRAPRIRTSSLMSPQRAFANPSPTTTRRTASPETPGPGLTPTYVSSGYFYNDQI